MSDFHSLKVVQITKLTPNAVAISFEIPQKLRSVFEFKAGQYITLRHEINGEEVRRAYSISSCPDDTHITIGVKKVEGGLFSVYANTMIKEGDKLEVMPPEGRFVYEAASKPETILAIAAGSGITPIMSIIQTVLGANPENNMVLVYGNRSKEETMFHKKIKELLEKYTDRFFVQSLYSRAHEDDGIFGRIEASTINFAIKNKFKDLVFDAYYICGPEQMINTVKETLGKNSIDPERVYTELFTSSKSSTASFVAENGLVEVNVLLDDEQFSFKMDKKKLVLDAVLDEGIDAPYSCQGGVCSTCIARITEGKAVMEQNQILTDSEIEEGLILTCQAHPITDILKIDYDDV